MPWPCTDREVFALYFQPPGWCQKLQTRVQCLRTRPKLLDELRLEIIPTGWALPECNTYGLGGPVKSLSVWQIHLVSHIRDSLLSLFCQRNQSSTHHILYSSRSYSNWHQPWSLKVTYSNTKYCNFSYLFESLSNLSIKCHFFCSFYWSIVDLQS